MKTIAQLTEETGFNFENGQPSSQRTEKGLYRLINGSLFFMYDLGRWEVTSAVAEFCPDYIEEEEETLVVTQPKLEPYKTQFFLTFGSAHLKDFNVQAHEVLVTMHGATEEELREAVRKSPIGNNFCTTYPTEYSEDFPSGAFIELDDLIKQYYIGGK